VQRKKTSVAFSERLKTAGTAGHQKGKTQGECGKSSPEPGRSGGKKVKKQIKGRRNESKIWRETENVLSEKETGCIGGGEGYPELFGW